MPIAKDIKDFLMTRHAKITPDQMGLPPGGRRRVAGLRREEVARLAGVSPEYYVQIERGQVAGVSEEVLHAIATALQLDEAETTHLFDLACLPVFPEAGSAGCGAVSGAFPKVMGEFSFGIAVSRSSALRRASCLFAATASARAAACW